MTLDFRYVPRAQQQYREATNWYYKQNPEIANAFAETVEKSIAIICQTTEVRRQRYKKFDHFFLKRFPYTIIYTVDETQQMIIIRSIYHQKRNPRNKYR